MKSPPAAVPTSRSTASRLPRALLLARPRRQDAAAQPERQDRVDAPEHLARRRLLVVVQSHRAHRAPQVQALVAPRAGVVPRLELVPRRRPVAAALLEQALALAAEGAARVPDSA